MDGVATAPRTAAAMVLDGVSFGYGPTQPVLRGVCAELAPGGLTVLIGPNAAGKSTLLRLMMGHLVPDDGRVLVGDQPIARLGASQRARQVSYVPQRGRCGFAFTVEQVVAMGRYAAGAAPGLVDWVLRVCDLGGLRSRQVNQLSVGQQQRVLLARALVQAAEVEPASTKAGTRCQDETDPGHDGRVMLLDEPVSAMDPRHVHQTMGLLHARTRRGLSALVVLHDMNLVARYADSVWLLHDGRLVAAGPWEQVLRPSILEPVYEVAFENVAKAGQRPLFRIEPSPAAKL